MGAQLFRKKNIDQLISDSELPEHRLKKSLGWLSLTSLGIGAVIGSGIFTIIGTAIAGQKLQFKSVLNAPLLEYLIYHSRRSGGRALDLRLRCHLCWWEWCALSRRFVTRSWRR